MPSQRYSTGKGLASISRSLDRYGKSLIPGQSHRSRSPHTFSHRCSCIIRILAELLLRRVSRHPGFVLVWSTVCIWRPMRDNHPHLHLAKLRGPEQQTPRIGRDHYTGHDLVLRILHSAVPVPSRTDSQTTVPLLCENSARPPHSLCYDHMDHIESRPSIWRLLPPATRGAWFATRVVVDQCHDIHHGGLQYPVCQHHGLLTLRKVARCPALATADDPAVQVRRSRLRRRRCCCGQGDLWRDPLVAARNHHAMARQPRRTRCGILRWLSVVSVTDLHQHQFQQYLIRKRYAYLQKPRDSDVDR
jgi:hypothetical protein